MPKNTETLKKIQQIHYIGSNSLFQKLWKQSQEPKTALTPAKTESNSFTEIDRAILLRGVIDVLRAKGIMFNIWHRYGLSRVYFLDDSWLSYGTNGGCIYGPTKETLAFKYRTEFGLSKMAKREVVTLGL